MTRKGQVVKSPKSPEVKYRKQLLGLSKSLQENTEALITPILRGLESEYVNDAYATTLAQAFDNLRMLYSNTGTQARIISESFTQGVNTVNKQRFYSAIEDIVGVNLSSIIQRENLEDILVATTRENVALIKSIPEEYFKKIETMVFTSTTQGNSAGSMIKQLKEIGNVTDRRAKLIARDQTSKLNSALNQQRQQNLGVEEYEWVTSKDERVRESHKQNNGKIFRWDSPPPTGHPGEEIQCRCVAKPIIKL